MNWIVYHVASGHSFFSGATLLIFAALASASARPTLNRSKLLMLLIGIISIVVSSTTLPYWLYAVAGAVTLVWIVTWYIPPWGRWAPYAMGAVWMLAALVELPYHFMPELRPVRDRRMTILGDSVTAGVGGSETSETWPSILAREHDLVVHDISHVGETAASALKRAQLQQIGSSVVVLELGGNDILGKTTAEQFERDLDALLAFVSSRDRQLVMLELPLPPFFHEYGRIQRTLAAKYDVFLVPKRVFLAVIAGSGSTLDTIHLSQSGHQAMADCVWEIVGPAFENQKGS